jgi:hypothetical protein
MLRIKTNFTTQLWELNSNSTVWQGPISNFYMKHVNRITSFLRIRKLGNAILDVQILLVLNCNDFYANRRTHYAILAVPNTPDLNICEVTHGIWMTDLKYISDN